MKVREGGREREGDDERESEREEEGTQSDLSGILFGGKEINGRRGDSGVGGGGLEVGGGRETVGHCLMLSVALCAERVRP